MRKVAFLVFALSSAACSLGGSDKTPDAGEVTAFYVDTGADDKALLYNLIGRWYPEEEIKRLSDRTLTPEQWCERDPTMIFIYPDSVQVRCNKGAEMSAMIAKVHRSKDGKIALTMRAKEDSPFHALAIEPRGPRATVSGSPCFEGKPTEYARFPEYEILSREILGGRRCAQILKPETAATAPSDSEP